MRLWMKVTNDRYELPLVVEDSAAELARRIGVDVGSIRSMVSKKKHGKVKKRTKYVCVEIDDDEKETDDPDRSGSGCSGGHIGNGH